MQRTAWHVRRDDSSSLVKLCSLAMNVGLNSVAEIALDGLRIFRSFVRPAPDKSQAYRESLLYLLLSAIRYRVPHQYRPRLVLRQRHHPHSARPLFGERARRVFCSIICDRLDSCLGRRNVRLVSFVDGVVVVCRGLSSINSRPTSTHHGRGKRRVRYWSGSSCGIDGHWDHAR